MTRPGNGPYMPPYSDGMYHFTVSISKELHASIAALLVISDKNRTEWIREAIAEKIARDTGREDTAESGMTYDKEMSAEKETK